MAANSENAASSAISAIYRSLWENTAWRSLEWFITIGWHSNGFAGKEKRWQSLGVL